jgi:hypothetical protein
MRAPRGAWTEWPISCSASKDRDQLVNPRVLERASEWRYVSLGGGWRNPEKA